MIVASLCVCKSKKHYHPKKKLSFFLNFVVPFYGWGSTASRLQSHDEEVVFFLPLSSQKFLVLI